SPTIGVAELRKGSCFVPVGLSPKREDYPGLGTSKSICPQALPRKARRAAFTPSLVKRHPHSVLPMRRVIRHRGGQRFQPEDLHIAHTGKNGFQNRSYL